MQLQKFNSLTVQTIYVVLTGLQLIFIPNVLLAMFGFEPTTEIWIKVLGLVVLSLAFCYYGIGKTGNNQKFIGQQNVIHVKIQTDAVGHFDKMPSEAVPIKRGRPKGVGFSSPFTWSGWIQERFAPES